MSSLPPPPPPPQAVMMEATTRERPNFERFFKQVIYPVPIDLYASEPNNKLPIVDDALFISKPSDVFYSFLQRYSIEYYLYITATLLLSALSLVTTKRY
jgi:hypothetical protein